MTAATRPPWKSLRSQAALLVLAVVAMTALVLGLGAGGARADEGGYSINRFDVDMILRGNGDLEISETIGVNFSEARHGIYRYVPFRYRYDDVYDREASISAPTISADGASSELASKTEGNNVVWRIGDPHRTVTGPVTYRINYVVHDIVLDEPDGRELLSWNAIGNGWNTPIYNPIVTLELPAQPTATRCFIGKFGSTDPCSSRKADGTTVHFAEPRGLAFNSAFTVEADLPAGTIQPRPVLKRSERFNFMRRFGAGKTNAPVAGGITVAALAGLGVVVRRRGRDAAFVPGTLDPEAQGGASGTTVVRAGPVELRPPDDIPPALLGTVIDEKADISDVTATIIDLAVRGYLTIAEVDHGAVRKKKDWTLTATGDDAPGRPAHPRDALLPFERRIYDRLFGAGPTVAISSLRNQFHTTMAKTQRDLYATMVDRHWYTRNPQTTRGIWLGLGVVVLALGGVLMAVLLAASHAAVYAVAPLALGVGIIAVSGRMPSRTAQGSTMYARVLGFKKFLETADGDQLRYGEKAGQLDRMLPYAMVLGITRQWTTRLAQLGLQASSPAWYVSPVPFDPVSFGDDLGSFLGTAGATLASSPSSSGGGFSGGGGGGGGGGSW